MDAASVETSFDEYMAAFESLDLSRIIPYFDEQLAIISSAGVIAMADREAIERVFEGLTTQLSGQDYARTEVLDRTTKMLSPSIAQVSALLVRYDSTGSEIGRFGAVYTLRNSDGSWKVGAIVMHDAA
jgi:hypothetical protein